MESITKKRKISEEKRKFNIQWTKKYFVSELFGNIICLICDDKISVCKKNNIKRHYASKHQPHGLATNIIAPDGGLMKKEEN